MSRASTRDVTGGRWEGKESRENPKTMPQGQYPSPDKEQGNQSSLTPCLSLVAEKEHNRRTRKNPPSKRAYVRPLQLFDSRPRRRAKRRRRSKACVPLSDKTIPSVNKRVCRDMASKSTKNEENTLQGNQERKHAMQPGGSETW